MTLGEDNDKYAVYTGVEDGAATFTLYDEEGPVGQKTISPDQIPEGTNYQDHFWVNLNEDGDIVEFQFDPQLTKQKQDEYQDAVEMYKKWQADDKEKRVEENDN